MKCNHDCFNCIYPDCIEDGLTAEEVKAANERDKQADVVLSDDYRTRWAQLNPERNRANKRRHYQNNKERYKKQHRAYYQAHKEELNRKRMELYYANREYELARQKERRRKKAEKVS